MGRDKTSLSVEDDVGDQIREMKKLSNASTNTEFFERLINDDETLEIRLEDLDTVELERTEEAKETRAMAVGVLEAMQKTGIKEDVIDLIEELRKREMIESNKEIMQYILGKAKKGESLNEADRELLSAVIQIESSREEESAATAIAEGLFGELEESTTETTTTETTSSSQSAEVESNVREVSEPLVDDVEDV